MLLSSRVRIALAFGVILVALALILAHGTRAPAPQNIVAWSGSGTLLQAINSAPVSSDRPAQDSAAQGVALDTSRLDALGMPSTNTQRGQDFASILAQLSNTPRPFATDASATAAADAIRDAFAQVPQFTVGSSASSETPARTPEQEAIFAYGNAAGNIIKAYEATHTDAVQIIAAQSTDRSSVQKAQALRTLGEAISGVGLNIKKITGVPSDAAEIHAQFAERYVQSGALLAHLADARDDQAYLAAVNAYNASVDSLIDAHVALATYFALAGVHFSSTDGGSIFSAQGFGGL